MAGPKLCFGFGSPSRANDQSGPVILAVNHQSYLDPPLVGNASDRAIYYLARKTLLTVPVLGRLLPKLNVIPVDQEGVDRSAQGTNSDSSSAGEWTSYFPEGYRTLDGDLTRFAWYRRSSSQKLALRGADEDFRGAGSLAPREKSVRLHPITVVVGEPIHFYRRRFRRFRARNLRQLSQRVMDAIAQIRLE